MDVLETALAIRAYTERPDQQALGSRKPSPDLEPSEWTLIFDCETTIDAVQRVRFGFFQVRRLDELDREGLFFDPESVTVAEESILREYAQARGVELIDVKEFRAILLKYGYTRLGTIVGFNLPFDISRIAVSHSEARRSMRGGYSFVLSADSEDPRVRVKHLSPRAAIIDFATPGDQDTGRGMRNRRLRVRPFRGHFVDVKTIANALLSRRCTLRSLAEFLNTPCRKHDTDEHGSMTPEYLDYGRADVQVTWECYQELKRRYDEHGLLKPIDRILSEASIGKGYLEKMGIRPLLSCNSSFPRERFGEAFCAYYGGRAEVRQRRVIREVLYCDFKSMYPTVNSLMGLWEFVIADGMHVEETTESTRRLLESISIGDLQQPETWRRLRTLVLLRPSEDVLPVRAKYDSKDFTIGLNRLTCEQPLWYTLADCIVSKVLTGRCPAIDKALTYRPGSQQRDLKRIRILNRDDYQIDPKKDDFFKCLIDMRDEAKANSDEIEKTIKIIANSTSYGIFIEIIRNDASRAEPLNVFGPNGDCIAVATKAIEEPGRYFNPILGVLITGAARLMLGLAERRVIDCGLDWAFCDTDSIAMVRPEGMDRDAFRNRAKDVINWFEPLNPYRKPESILKREEINLGIDSKELEPLFCYAISAKRYVLFNLDGGRPVLRKASAHGLGQLSAPYDDQDAPPELPRPRVALPKIGVRRWQHDVWIKIVQAALAGNPTKVVLDWHPAFFRPAAMKYSATSPDMLGWLKSWNEGKAYQEQIRPFGFLMIHSARTGVFAEAADIETTDIEVPRRGRPPKAEEPKPIAPYDDNPTRALMKVFDRVTGQPVEPERLKTYAEALCQYHISPENKFLNGQFLDRGRTERRHVLPTGIVLIGKEANRVGESGEADPLLAAVQILQT